MWKASKTLIEVLKLEILYYEVQWVLSAIYHKSGNFYVKIIHVLNIYFNLFLWVYGTHENILT